MGYEVDGTLHEFVVTRYPDLRRSAFLMCGDWATADELTQAALARLVAEAHGVDDPDAYVYGELMAAFQHRRPRREHVFVAAPTEKSSDAEADSDQLRTVLVLDALHKLAPRCRAVMVLRHWTGFAVDETADMLGLADERVRAYEAAGLAALEKLLAGELRDEETPADGAPAETPPAAELRGEETSAEDAPAVDLRGEEAPAEGGPVEELRDKETPAEDAPAPELRDEKTSEGDAPAEKLPAEEAPAR